MAGRIQNEDLKSEAELIALGANRTRLPNTDKIYIPEFGQAKTMSEALSQRLLHGSPLLIHANTTPDAKLYFEPSSVPTIEGTARVMPPLKSQIFSIASSWIDFQLQTTSGGPFIIAWPTSTVGFFRYVGFTLLSSGSIQALFTPEAATVGALDNPGTCFVSGGMPLGYVLLESTNASGQFKTAGSTTNVIENSVGGVSRVFCFGSGGGGSAEATSGAPVSPADGYRLMVSDDFSDVPTSPDSYVRTETSAHHDTSKEYYRMNCDKTKTVGTVGLAFTLSAAPSFTLTANCIIYAGGQWRRIASIVSQTQGQLDAAFSPDLPSGTTCMVSEAVFTKDLVNIGSATEKTRPRDFYPNVAMTSINLAYEDSLAAGDGIADYVDAARVVASACAQGVQADITWPTSDLFSPIYTRPAAPNQIMNYNLAASGERLFLAFFPNPNEAAVVSAANLLGYEASIYEIETLLNGGYIESAFAMSDGSGTPNNSNAPTVVSGKTRWKIFPFAQGINGNRTTGALEILVDGRVIPRYIAGVTLDAYWKEVAGSNDTVEFWSDLSGYPLSLEARMREGSVDTSSQNAARLGALMHAVVGTAGDVATGAATHVSLQQAINDTTVGASIKMLIASITENVTLDSRRMIEGMGYDSYINGSFTFGQNSDYSIVKKIRANSFTLQVGADGNILTDFFAGAIPTDSGTGNVVSNGVEV